MLHSVFQMNMPEVRLKEMIKECFTKIEKVYDIGALKLVCTYLQNRG